MFVQVFLQYMSAHAYFHVCASIDLEREKDRMPSDNT